MNPTTSTSTNPTYSELLTENTNLKKQNSELKDALTNLVTKNLQEKPASVKGLVYRTVCYHCAQFIEVPKEAIKCRTGIGSGRDSDGTYDSGHDETSFECTACKTALSFRDTLGNKVGSLGFVQHYNS